MIVDYKEKINDHAEKIANYKSVQIQSSANQELKKWQDLKEMLLLKSLYYFKKSLFYYSIFNLYVLNR